MHAQKKDRTRFLLLAALAVTLVFVGTPLALAWSGPPSNPPAGNAPAPINVSSASQTKAGNLEIDGSENSGTTAALIVTSGTSKLLMDGNEVDSAAGTLYLNNNSSTLVKTGGGLTTTGDLTAGGDLYANGAYLYGDGKMALKYSDTWLRLNPNGDFTSGVYAASSILRTDGSLQVGSAGADFLADSNGNVTAGNTVTSPKFCIGSSCITSWPSGSSGTLTGVTAGDGLSGGGTTGTVTLKVDSSVVRTTGTQSVAGTKTFSDAPHITDNSLYLDNAGWSYLRSETGSGIILRTSGTNVLAVTSGGNVGIGTTNPSMKFSVAGDANISTSVTSPKFCIGSSCITAWPAAGTNDPWSQSGSNVYYKGGNVGIGTSVPASQLSVLGSTSLNGDVQVSGDDNNGTTAAFSVTSGSSNLLVDGNEIDSNGTLYLNHNSAGEVDLGGDLSANNISVAGSDIVSWPSFGGGWYMKDTTWMRSYGNKSVYTGGQMRADAGFCIGSSNCVTSFLQLGAQFYYNPGSYLTLPAIATGSNGTVYTGGISSGLWKCPSGSIMIGFQIGYPAGSYTWGDPANGSAYGGTSSYPAAPNQLLCQYLN